LHWRPRHSSRTRSLVPDILRTSRLRAFGVKPVNSCKHAESSPRHLNNSMPVAFVKWNRNPTRSFLRPASQVPSAIEILGR